MIFILGVFISIDLAERVSYVVNFPDPLNGQVGGAKSYPEITSFCHLDYFFKF